MPLPACSGAAAVRAFERAGWTVKRQKGSHIILGQRGKPNVLSVPDHKTLKPGTLRGLIRAAGLSVDEFTDLL